MPRDRQPRRYPRALRVNEALREVLADELERLDDERLELVTVTGVSVDPDLRKAIVWFSALHGQEHAAETLAEHRKRLQAAVARQLRLRRTPELSFRPDHGIEAGLRVEGVLRDLSSDADERDASAGDTDA